jgi:hypothetical protein
LGVCNESCSYESIHVETLFDVFPFDDTIFEQDHVLSNETFLEDEYCEGNNLDLHGIAPHILLPHGHSKESRKDDSGDDVASCDFYFENMV